MAGGGMCCLFSTTCMAATESTIVYQDTLDSVGQSYAGEISKASTPEYSNIRVVRRGEKAKSATPAEQFPTRIDANKMSLYWLYR